MSAHDRELGLHRRITRRDFVNGAAVTLTGIAAGGTRGLAHGAEPPYPPALTGMRGSGYPGAYATGHALRDGTFWPHAPRAADTGERYDLIVVGGGISGLSAAYLYQKQHGFRRRVLILDNHDDFGGHAKRNEFDLGGHLHLMNGGTLEIDSPRPYGPVAAGLLKTLGLDVPALARSTQHLKFYGTLGLHGGAFFDRETFGADKLVVGYEPDQRGIDDARRLEALLREAPLSDQARADIVRLETAHIDYLPDASSDEKKRRLSRMSYDAFLRDVVKADPAVLRFYRARTMGEWGVGTDAVSALDCWAFDFPGFQGMKLAQGSIPQMGYTPSGYADTGGSFKLHFPDGNATMARLLVRNLIPRAVPGHGVADVVTARVDYSQLDRPEAGVRLRLNSIVIRARHIDGAPPAAAVEVTYLRGGRPYTARARGVVMACYNMMIPYLCPELPPAQKDALHKLVKTPLVYTSVALRNWEAFHRLNLYRVYAPGSYHCYVRLNPHVNIGGYRSTRSPHEPILVHMVRTPCRPGLPEHDQNRAGRAELLSTSFETFERNIRDQLGRTLKDGGFDPARDITAITVNRWPHGYAPEYNPLFDPDVPESERPHVIGRAQFGRITIANSDAGGGAYTDSAINQGHRAVMELLHSAAT
jgi:spermidine dehydrogenase